MTEPTAAPTSTPAAAPAATALPTGGDNQTPAASPTAPAAPAQPATLLTGTDPAAPAAQPQDPNGQVTDPGTKTEGTSGAPEKYEFKPVTGAELAPPVIEKFSEVAKELNLSQESAQKVLDQVAPVIAAQQQAAVKAINDQWVNAVKADPEIGGDKLQANLVYSKKAMDAFGSDELRTLLNTTGIGNNPALLKAFIKIGQAIGEDNKIVPGGSRPPAGEKTHAQILYG